MAGDRVVVQLDVPASAVELASDRLWQAGPSAVLEVDLGDGWVRLTADVSSATGPVMPDPAWRMTTVAVDGDGYLDAWRTWATPIRAGARTVLHPSWLEPAEPDPGDLVVLLDPGHAFGSGSHESTRLAVAALEAVVADGATVLDVGCGSGVLSVVACRLGAASAVAVDVAPEAVAATVANAAANGCADRITASTTALGEVAGTYDVVVANIGGSVLFDLAGDLAARVAPGGHLVLAGILDERADALVAALGGLEEVGRTSEAGWAGLVVRAPRAVPPGAAS